MPRNAALKQSELTRYAKALSAAGVSEWRVIAHPNGSHEIIVGSLEQDSSAELRRALDAATGVA